MCMCHGPCNMKNRKQQSHGDKTKLFPKHLRQQTQIRFCGIKAKFDMRCRVTRGGFRARVCLRGLRYMSEQVSEIAARLNTSIPSVLSKCVYWLSLIFFPFSPFPKLTEFMLSTVNSRKSSCLFFKSVHSVFLQTLPI